MQRNKLIKRVEKVVKDIDFAGSVYIKQKNEVIYESAFGFADRAEERTNKVDTRFGIASGCKLFTAIAICQLVEQGKLSFQTRLIDCVDIDFPSFDEWITIHHLLTHSSGIPDYFDEDEMSDYEDLWKIQPAYTLKNLRDFLPLFQNEKMKFKPGNTFHYNNAGYIVLGLVVEQQTGVLFSDYVEREIFQRCSMKSSGYFSLDNLPANTAHGYIDKADGSFRTNVFSIPSIGGSDGGAFVSAPDMMRLWDCLFDHSILSLASTGKLLTPHIKDKNDHYYGYGLWINRVKNHVFKYYLMGYDPGVSFHASVYPDKDIKLIVCSNKQSGPISIIKEVENIIQEW